MKRLNYEHLLQNKKRRLVSLLFLLALVIPLNSQDEFFDEDESFGDSDADGSGAKKALDFSGFANLGIRYWPHEDLQRTDVYPNFGIDLKNEGSKTELSTSLRLNPNSLSEYPLDALNEFTMSAFLGDFVLSAGKMKLVWGKGDMLHVLDVFNANDFTDFTIPTYIDRRIGEPMVHLAYNAPIPLRLELAWTPMMTPDRIALSGPWVPSQIQGMKDKAMDILENPEDLHCERLQDDLTKLIVKGMQSATGSSVIVEIPNYTEAEIDSMLASVPAIERPALKLVLLALRGKKIPVLGFPSNSAAQEVFAKEVAKTLLTKEIPKKFKLAKQAINTFSIDPFIKMGMNSFLPDMHNVKYGQYGVRLTGTAGSVDMGAQYYYGHYKTPSIDYEKMLSLAFTGGNLKSAVHYDPVHIFGVDLGAAIAMFNIKTEFAYYMTNDFKGTDPAVHNNSVQWVAGFDVNIPLNNLNVNIQNLGSWILGFKNVKDNNDTGRIDMDWNTAKKSTNNKLIVNISDSWLHENLKDSVTVIWGIEHNDVVVMPSIKYKIIDELYVEGMGAYIYAKDDKSEFSNWQNNHFVQLSMEYKF